MTNKEIPNLRDDIKEDKEEIERNGSKEKNVTLKISEIQAKGKEERKKERLIILKWALFGVGIGFLFSIITTIVITVCFQFETPPELIVLNTVLGSSLTTIIGVIAGTSID